MQRADVHTPRRRTLPTLTGRSRSRRQPVLAARGRAGPCDLRRSKLEVGRKHGPNDAAVRISPGLVAFGRLPPSNRFANDTPPKRHACFAVVTSGGTYRSSRADEVHDPPAQRHNHRRQARVRQRHPHGPHRHVRESWPLRHTESPDMPAFVGVVGNPRRVVNNFAFARASAARWSSQSATRAFRGRSAGAGGCRTPSA